MWDASMPKVEQCLQFPHMIFWTPDGLIKRILMQNSTPGISFWLTDAQLNLVDDSPTSPWQGLNAPEEEFSTDDESGSDVDSDEESESEEEEEEEKDVGGGDVRDLNGVALSALAYVPSKGTQRLAEEYTPGISLTIINPSTNYL